MTAPVAAAGRQERLERRARLLAWATIAYNTLEGVVAVAAGAAASSVALVSFGLDSAIEVASAAVLAWQFGGRGDPRVRERRALRLIALSFFGLAAYVTIDATRSLATGAVAGESRVGIGLAAASLVVMPALVWAKRRVGRALGSVTVVADSTQTLLCTYLSAVLLAGLVVNATLGWSWADPAVALVVALVAVREGLRAWRGDACCAVPSSGLGSAGSQAAGCCGSESGDSCECGHRS